MIENNKISVIVPVYNVENYLKDCIESVINQTYKNIEIILVDDGSTDNSGRICDEYAKNDKRINVIHKKNGGLSSARNTGLDVASGDYIMFLDSDDLFLPSSCELMLKEIEDKIADYVIGNYQNCTEEGELWDFPVFDINKYKEFKLDIKDYKNSFFIMNSSACNKIFRTSFLKKLNMRFVEGVPAEDAIFTTHCFIKSKNVYYIPDVMYLYRQRNVASSISTSCSANYFFGISKAYRIIYENFKNNNEINFYRCFYAKSMTYMLYKFIDSKLLSDEERLEVLADMRWFYKLSIDLSVPACQESLSVIINKIIDGDYKDAIDICRVVSDIRVKLPKEIKENMSKPGPEMYDSLFEVEVSI